MKQVILKDGDICLVSDEDFDRVMEIPWRLSEFRNKAYAAKTLKVNGHWIKVYMHRFIMNAPAGLVVDHIDGNGLNNQRENLRIVTQRENIAHTMFKPKWSEPAERFLKEAG